MDPRSRSGSGGSLSGTVRGAAGAGSSERQFGRRFGREKREYFDCEGGEE